MMQIPEEEVMVNAKWWFLAATVLPPAAPAVETQFAGFSAVAVSAHVGLAGMHGACQAAFGSRARMCLTDEVVRSPEIVEFTQNLQAWVQPGADRFPCAGWTSAVGSGTVLDARTMSFLNKSCAAMLPVTCCQEQALVRR
nr:hypothetical protein [Gammaproteobacteria bacterium]